jgi:Domain of unknown function (DUF4167)
MNAYSMKRQRGRGRKPGGGGGGGHHNNHGQHQPNRTMESNGPEGKVRGPASLICDRYLQLARDAYSAGDRVLAENFFQHADHYFRLLRAMQPAAPPPSERLGSESDYEEGDDEAAASENEAPAPRETRVAAEPSVVGEAAAGEAGQGDRSDDDFRRRRGRRNRFRPGGEEGAEAPREPRQAREPRENERPENTAEGFSGGPRPAFLRTE